MASRTWEEKLGASVSSQLSDEIRIFESQIALRKQGKLEDTLFAETRLRRGVYGQRYDNGQRHDGVASRKLAYEDVPTKGPNTVWDAPGMQRIKIPMGKLSIEQLEVLADISEEYADGICHATTRQDIQLHFVHIDDTPDMMRRLAAVGITTREACGNSVRNVTACPYAGVCRTETFDITPYAKACTYFLLGHPDVQDFGRKFKIAYSGCAHEACGLVAMHDLGFVAKTKEIDGQTQYGFTLYVGGGLGAVPYQAKIFDEFLPVEEMLPISQAISRVYARLGEKKNRAKARIKFLVAKLGIDEFRKLVLEERGKLPPDPRWTTFLSDLEDGVERPLKAAAKLSTADKDLPADFLAWRKTNVSPQRQDHYHVVHITLPLGDATATQVRALADIARTYCGDTIRVTVDQNFALRWVSEADLPAVYKALQDAQLAQAGANTIVDITACPGTDTCKLGISASRGLASELRQRLIEKNYELDEAVKGLHIKISGCYNSCGQHHLADLGFYGVNRKVGNHAVPHFQVVVGGQWSENAGSYGLAIGAVPSKRIPQTVELFTERFVKQRNANESFQSFIKRIGKAEIKSWLKDLSQVPAYEVDASFYSDWSDPREFTMGDHGVGECAGEVVSSIDFGLAEAERVAFEAQLKLDANDTQTAAELAYKAMLHAAHALVRTENIDVKQDDAATIISEFRSRFYDTKRFFDPFAGGKFANYLFAQHDQPARQASIDDARQRLEEAQLFIEAAHSCNARLSNAA